MAGEGLSFRFDELGRFQFLHLCREVVAAEFGATPSELHETPGVVALTLPEGPPVAVAAALWVPAGPAETRGSVVLSLAAPATSTEFLPPTRRTRSAPTKPIVVPSGSVRAPPNSPPERSTTNEAEPFLMTGALPNTEWVEGCVVRDDKGFVKAGADLRPDELREARWPLARAPYLAETSLRRICRGRRALGQREARGLRSRRRRRLRSARPPGPGGVVEPRGAAGLASARHRATPEWALLASLSAWRCRAQSHACRAGFPGPAVQPP